MYVWRELWWSVMYESNTNTYLNGIKHKYLLEWGVLSRGKICLIRSLNAPISVNPIPHPQGPCRGFWQVKTNIRVQYSLSKSSPSLPFYTTRYVRIPGLPYHLFSKYWKMEFTNSNHRTARITTFSASLLAGAGPEMCRFYHVQNSIIIDFFFFQKTRFYQ